MYSFNCITFMSCKQQTLIDLFVMRSTSKVQYPCAVVGYSRYRPAIVVRGMHFGCVPSSEPNNKQHLKRASCVLGLDASYFDILEN